MNRFTFLFELCCQFPVDCARGFLVDSKISIKNSTAYQSCQSQGPTEHRTWRHGTIMFTYISYISVIICFVFLFIGFISFLFCLLFGLLCLFSFLCVAIVSVVSAEGSAWSGWIDWGADSWRTFGSDSRRAGAPLDSIEETACGYPSCHRTVLFTNH